MSTPANPMPQIPTADQVLLPGSSDVELTGVAQPLIDYAVHLAYLHWLLFGSPLIARGAKDKRGCVWCGHSEGKAIDFLVSDLAGEEFQLFYSIVGFSASPRGLGVWWDVTNGEPTFVHVELRA